METSDILFEKSDVILIGAGIMSATLGMLLKQLQPDYIITILERLDIAAAESSDAWNNAGTGHSGFCELNYTPQLANGSIDTSKAIQTAESFEVSRQFWAYLVESGSINSPDSFIENIPHMSCVWGNENVDFLKARYRALKKSHLFENMQYSEDPSQLEDWMPLVMEGRNNEKMAATRVETGTDVNFGSLTRGIFNKLKEADGISIHFNQDVYDLIKHDNEWNIKIKDLKSGQKATIQSKFVFIGAGGGSLPLLLKSGIPEGQGFGGFPVSGQWLKCINPEIIKKHHAKIYGKASVGAPPMSVPHLDTRIIQGNKALLFGPYAGFTTKFLKNGSVLDLLSSINLSNILPMVTAGLANIDLTKYLIEQIRQSPEDRLVALQEFIPGAQLEDWELEIAGQRVQVIKNDPVEGGILEFGTEIVTSADGSIAALLGASPGASTAVSIMLNLLQQCFPDKITSQVWVDKLKTMIPSYGQLLSDDAILCREIREWTSNVLDLKNT